MNRFYTTAVALCLLLTSGSVAQALVYEDEVLADSPLGYWRFEETEGVATDSSGNERHGTYMPGVTPGVAPGAGAIGGTAAEFDGVAGYINLPGTWGGIDMTETTLEALVNTSEPVPSDFQAIIAGHDPNGFAHFQLYYTPNPAAQTGLYTDSVFAAVTAPQATPTGVWRHVVMTGKSGETILYIDGEQVGSSTAAFSSITPSSNVDIGRGHVGTRWFSGLLDEVAIYDTALSAERVLAHSDAAFGLTVLSWDELGSDNWGSASWTGGPLEFPDATVRTTVNATSADTITVATDQAAYSLAFGGGTLAIDPGQKLTVSTEADFAAGTAVTLGNGATFSVGSGSSDSITMAGNGTIGVATGTMPVATLTNTAPGTFTKQGAGTLVLDNSSGVGLSGGADTVFRIEAGTLRTRGAAPLDGATQLVLAGGEFSVADAFTPTTVAAPAGAVGAWTFSEGSGSVAVDSAGGNDGAIVGAAWLDDSQRGTVLDFEGTAYVDIPAAAFSTVDAAISISLWQYGDPAIQPQNDYIFEGRIGGGEGLGSHLPWSNSNVYWDAGGASGCCNDRSNQVASPAEFEGQWNHWVFTKDTATGLQKMYLNGVEWASAEGRTLSLAGIDLFKIGSHYDGGSNYDGMVDDFFVYDRALTLEEVQTLAAMEPGRIPADVSTTNVLVTADSAINSQSAGAAFGALTLQSGVLTTMGQPISFTQTTVPADATGAIGFDPQVPTDYGVIDVNSAHVAIVKGGPSQWLLESAPENIENATWEVRGGTLEVIGEGPLGGRPVTLAGGTFAVTGARTAPGAAPADAVAHWAFDEGSGGVAADSVAGNDGTITGAAWLDDVQRGMVLDFEGAAYVDIPAAAFSTVDAAISISLWQYGDPAIQPQSDYVFEGGVAGVRGLGSHLPWSNSIVYWDAGGASGCCNDRLDKAAAVADFEGQWNHWVFTKDTATGLQKMYLNGVEWASAEGRTLSVAGIDLFKIGSDMNGGSNYDGMVDDFLVYDRALTAAEVAAMNGLLPPDMSATDLTVTADSTLNLMSFEPVSFASLTLQSGVLTTTGADVSFTSTGIDAAATAVGINAQTATDLGLIDGNSAAVTISKLGSADLVLDQPNANLDNATFAAREGRLIGVHGPNPFGGASLQLVGGELVLAAKAEATDVTYDNALTVEGSNTLTAGAGGVGAAGPLTVSLGSAANGVDLGGGTLALRSTDDYTLNIVGPVTGPGTIGVAEGTVALGSATGVGLIEVTGGTLTTGAGVAVDNLRINGGTLGNDVTVRDKMILGKTSFSMEGADAFTASGSDLLTGANVTIAGGTLRVGIPGVPSGAIGYWKFDETDGDEAVNAAQPGTFDGLVTEATWTDDPVRGRVLNFDGDGDSVEIPEMGDTWDEISYSLWLNINSVPDSLDSIIDDNAWAGGALHWSLRDGGLLGGNVNGVTGTFLSNFAFTEDEIGNWHHLVATYKSGDKLTFYVDGVEDSFFDVSERSIIMGPRRIGSWNESRFMDAMFDDLFVYDRALGPDEVDALFNAAEEVPLDLPGVSLTITADSVLQLDTYEDAVFGNLSMDDGVTLVVAGPAISLGNIDAGDGATIAGIVLLRGTMAPGGAGTLTIDGELEMGDEAEYLATFDGTANDLVTVAGDVYLDGTLTLQATGQLETVGDHTRTILSLDDEEAEVMEEFASVPAAGDHIGSGVFYEEVVYPATSSSVEVELFQAAAGDADGNRQVDNADLQSILGANSFNNGTGFDWTQGDFNNDTVVDNSDLQLILATGFFGTGQYVATAGGAAAAVPEPSSIVLLAMGLLAFAMHVRSRRRRR